jgi:hypothetical protein
VTVLIVDRFPKPKLSDLVGDLLDRGTTKGNPLISNPDSPGGYLMRYDGIEFCIDKDEITISLVWNNQPVHSYSAPFDRHRPTDIVRLNDLHGAVDVILNRPGKSYG